MKIAVLGATGATGRLVIEQALEQGDKVVAYVRKSQGLTQRQGLVIVEGQLDDTFAMQTAILDTDAVLVCLGTRKKKPVDLMQKAIPQIIRVMKDVGVMRLVLLSAYGVGDSVQTAGFIARFVYKTWAASFYRDKELSEALLLDSELKWTCIYPVGLTNEPMLDSVDVRPMSLVRKVSGLPMVSRANVARTMLKSINDDQTVGQKMLVSSVGSVR